MDGDSEKESAFMLGLVVKVRHETHNKRVKVWESVGGVGTYVRPVERLTPARKAETRTASKA